MVFLCESPLCHGYCTLLKCYCVNKLDTWQIDLIFIAKIVGENSVGKQLVNRDASNHNREVLKNSKEPFETSLNHEIFINIGSVGFLNCGWLNRMDVYYSYMLFNIVLLSRYLYWCFIKVDCFLSIEQTDRLETRYRPVLQHKAVESSSGFYHGDIC